MAILRPFRGIRATRDKMHLVASRSFLSYTEAELNEKLTNNPYTFLHVIHPTQKRDVAEQIKFLEVRNLFDAYVRNGVLVQETTESFYLYRQIKSGKTYLGWIGGIAIEDYQKGVIKIHEHTIEARENLFAEYLAITGINAEPVLMFAQLQSDFRSWMKGLQARQPLADFSTTDQAQHTIWCVDAPEEVSRIQKAFEAINTVYIADGHHRSASSERLHRQHPDWPGTAHFLSYIIDEEDLTIHPFHRLVKDVRFDEQQILEKIRERFESYTDLVQAEHPPKGVFGVVSKNNVTWWKFKEDVSIDPERLANQVLAPIFEFEDFRKDRRLKYSEGPKGIAHLQEQITNGQATVGFVLSAVGVDQLKSVADAHGVMPPKSTYIEPKLRSGLIIYPITYGI
jgi:uncharacterized protein (DUF1015 family)